MQHFKDYLLERENKLVLDFPEGFCVYRIFQEARYCEICELYVAKEFRKQHVGTRVADKLAEMAREVGCAMFVASVVPSTNGSTDSLKTVLAYGFKLHHAEPDKIWLTKDISKQQGGE